MYIFILILLEIKNRWSHLFTLVKLLRFSFLKIKFNREYIGRLKIINWSLYIIDHPFTYGLDKLGRYWNIKHHYHMLMHTWFWQMKSYFIIDMYGYFHVGFNTKLNIHITDKIWYTVVESINVQEHFINCDVAVDNDENQ